jgi:hypothetical protein
MILAILAFTLSAAAKTPAMPGDPLRLEAGTVDALQTPALRAPEGFLGDVSLGHARGLVTWLSTTGAEPATGTERSMLSQATALHLAASLGGPRGDVSVTVPTYLHLEGELLTASGGALGDAAMQLRARITPWLSGRIGASLPTGDSVRMAGYGQPTATAGLIAGGAAGRASASYQLTPPANLGAQTFDDVLHLAAAWTPELKAGWRLSTELTGQLRRQPQPAKGVTAELLIGGHHQAGQRLLHLGGGLGLLPGAGTPSWRLLIGVGAQRAGD